jgi:hypothetical protein
MKNLAFFQVPGGFVVLAGTLRCSAPNLLFYGFGAGRGVGGASHR